MTLPETGHRCRGDGDTTFFFLRHPVGGCTVAVAFDHTDFVGQTSAVQNTLSCRRFTGINMGDNTDISKIFQRNIRLCHNFPLYYVNLSRSLVNFLAPKNYSYCQLYQIATENNSLIL